MKNLFISLALVGAIVMAGQTTFAACGCCNQVEARTPFYYYLNPLQYVGIGDNYKSFSLNPMTGFRNCNKAKYHKCDECTKAMITPCPTCQKAFNEPTCNSCNRIIYQPVQPRCTSCGH